MTIQLPCSALIATVVMLAATFGRSEMTHAQTKATEFSGKASFYSSGAGKTASGEAYDHQKLTCAHRTLPFGTKLKVTYKGRSAIVVVNDRGPFKKGRVLDLSGGVAQALGVPATGVLLVSAAVQ